VSEVAMVTTSAAAAATFATVILDTPILRGDTEIESIQIRKPSAGELRGLSLALLGQMDVDQLAKLLPRITIPNLLPDEIARLEPCDLMECADKVMDFLLSKARKAALPTT